MTTFNDKEKAAENKYAHDKETEFKIHARRDKIFGLWAAETLGFHGVAADEYAKQLVGEDWNKAGDEFIVAKARTDFADKGVSVADHDIRAKLHHAAEQAKLQVKG